MSSDFSKNFPTPSLDSEFVYEKYSQNTDWDGKDDALESLVLSFTCRVFSASVLSSAATVKVGVP